MELFVEKKYKYEGLIAALFIGICIFFLYKSVFKNPNQFLVAGGDGLKNYYTYLYHIKNDTKYWTMDGMNYPFGENIIFTDNQPILANALKSLHTIFPSIGCNLIAIHNLFLLFGLLLGGLGLFRVLRQLKIDILFALIVSTGLIIMNPQIPRFNGHYGLFYPLLPWIFLWLIRIYQGANSTRLSIYIGLFITVTGLLHMYHFVTAALLCVIWGITVVVAERSWRSFRSFLLQVLLQVAVPFIILTFFASYFNHATDRPSTPYGFFEYRSFWEGLFFSYKLPLFHFVNENIVTVRELNSEGKSYIGILAVFTFLALLLALLFGNKTTRKYFTLQSLSGKVFWVFFTVSLVAFGVPFIIPGCEDLLEYTGPFKQFRSIGRMTWVSFYAINIFTISILYNYLQKIEDTLKRTLLLASVAAMVFIEGLWIQDKSYLALSDNKAFQCNNELSKLPIKKGDYQALLPNPYFSIGSECFGWWDLGNEINYNFEIGYNFALPTLGTNLSRTSFQQAFLLNELVCKPYAVPKIIQMLKLKDPRPLLVLESKADFFEKRNSINYWTENAPIVFESDQYRLRKLELSNFDSVVAKNLAFVRNFIDSSKVIKTDFQSVTLSRTSEKEGQNYAGELTVDTTILGGNIFSYWLEVTEAGAAAAITEIWQYDDHNVEVDYVGEANHYNYKMYDGNKLLIETPLIIKSNTKRIKFKISTKDKRVPMQYSRAMLLKSGEYVKEVQSNRLYFNNYLIAR